MIWAVIAVVVICLCVVVVIAGAVAVYLFAADVTPSFDLPITEVTVEPPVSLDRPLGGVTSNETAETLAAVVVPDMDPYALACRLKSICGVSTTLPAPAKPYAVGDTRKFWIQNQDTIEHFQVDVTLRYVTPHSYFWVGSDVDADDDEIAALMTTFEEEIYPTNRRFFGSEWSPGVDQDPHINVLYVGGVGNSTGGYYSPHDEFNPAVNQYSNGAELFVFNSDGASLTDQYTYGILAHEFQHMIHWNLDRNETSWINEGFAELAAFLNGYGVGGHDWFYVEEPDIPLADWTSLSDSPDVSSRHYGQSFLFLNYFLDRFGVEATQALVKHEENGLASVDLVLQELNITDPQSGKPITAQDLALDWMLTMYLGDPSVGDGRYTYDNYPDAPRTTAAHKIDRCPAESLSGSVSQFGPEYVEITCAGEQTLEFQGSTAAKVLPTDAHSGSYSFWSNKGDLSNMTLTRDFDFTDVTGSIDLSYWTWYDIEEGWDYLYLETSLDGETWQIIETPSCTSVDKSGNSFGCGFTGRSGGGEQAIWTEESVDLSEYAGEKVQLRFEYVTDAALNGAGLLLDDLSVKAINYTEDFEAGDGGWGADGFALIQNLLPQTYRLALIKVGDDDTTVEYLEVRDDQTATIPLSLSSGERAVLVITGTQPFTTLPAGYTLEVK
jgi:hypothetical protein